MESFCQEDIIIKCSLEEMVKAFFKDYVIVWHDPNLISQENQEYMTKLRKFCEVLTFTDVQKATDYIKTTKAICHVITSGTNGELLVKGISLCENLANIYVFCRNKEYHLSWAQSYQKISCVEVQIGDVLAQIQQDLLQWYQKSSSLKLTLPAFAPIFNDGDKSKMNNLHRFLKVIPNFQNRKQAKNDFIALSKAIYSDEANGENIADFELTYNDYNKVQTLNWYTKESFLYKVANKCLRIATSDSVQYCRLLLRDLEQAIKDQYQAKSKNFNGLLYRGSYLSKEEWESLKENTGREIEMHGFLSASKEKRIAEGFLKGDKSKTAFITIIVPKGPNDEEQGFAEIEEFSAFGAEKEILFNVRSRFTVIETEEKYSENLPYRHLVLLYGAQGFRKSAAKKTPIPIQKASISNFQEISCAHCKVEMNKMPQKMAFWALAENLCYCQTCIDEQDVEGPLVFLPTTVISNSYYFGSSIQISGCVLINSTKTPFYGYECCKCKTKKQKRYFKCPDCSCSSQNKDTYCENCLGDCQQAGHRTILEKNPYTFWCQKMTQSESSHLEFQHQLMTKSEIFQQPEMYFESHEYEKAMTYYMTYLEHRKANDADENIATACNHIGLIFQKKGLYKEALEYHNKALEMYKSVHGEDHYDVAAAYYNLGRVSYHQADYKNAMEGYFSCLKIYEIVYKTHHPRIATVYGNIANVYRNQGDFKKAHEYQEKALKIRKAVYGENHPHVASSYNDIGNLHDSQGESKKALEYHLKSLKIDKSIYGEYHPNIAASYNNIGSSYSQQKKYREALEYHSKALDIYRSFYEENHPNIATCYNNLGMVNMDQGEYDEAEGYLEKALKIRESVYGENHPHVATCYNNLGFLCENKGEYEKAQEYHQKTLNIRRLIYGEKHPELITCYQNIENVQIKQHNNMPVSFGLPPVKAEHNIDNSLIQKKPLAGSFKIPTVFSKAVGVAGGHGIHSFSPDAALLQNGGKYDYAPQIQNYNNPIKKPVNWMLTKPKNMN